MTVSHSVTGVCRLLEETLNELDVTDGEFREMRYALPLTKELARRVVAEPSRRVLLVGAGGLLREGLERAGVSCQTAAMDLGGAVRSPPQGPDDESAAPDTLVIVFPVDAIDAERLLWRLSNRIAGQGRMIIAMRRAPRPRRGGRRSDGSQRCSSRRRDTFDPTRLRSWAKATGWRVSETAAVIAEEVWLSGKPLTLGAWLRAEAAHATKTYLPGYRDCLIVTLRRDLDVGGD